MAALVGVFHGSFNVTVVNLGGLMNGLELHHPRNVFIIGDHPITNVGLKSILDQTDDLQVIGFGPGDLNTLDNLIEINPDIVIIDAYICQLTGEFVATELKKRGMSVVVVVLAPIIDEVHFRTMIAAGVSGYLLKTETIDFILDSIRATSCGEKRVSSIFIDLFTSLGVDGTTKSGLTERELDVLELLAKGRSNIDIAHSLDIAEATVKNHIVSIYSKLGVCNRVEALLWAQSHGIV